MTKKKEPRKGIDSWTSNGYGLTFGKNNNTPAQKELIAQLNGAKKTKAGTKGKTQTKKK